MPEMHGSRSNELSIVKNAGILIPASCSPDSFCPIRQAKTQIAPWGRVRLIPMFFQYQRYGLGR